MTTEQLRMALVFRLRRFARLYRLLRFVRRAVSNLFVETLRKILPTAVCWGPPKGFFSAFEQLEQNRLQGRVLLRGQKVPPAARDSLRKICGLQQDGCQPWPVFWTYHPRARLVGRTLVLLDDQKRLLVEGAFGLPWVRDDAAYRNVFLPAATHLPGDWTSLVGRWMDGFYHWFMDALPRLAMLPELPPQTRILVPSRLEHYQLDTLRWLGLEGRIRPTSERHLIIERFYFCSTTAMTGCYNPFAVQFLRRSFLEHADTTYDSPRRFYLQRRGKSRPILNEAEVLKFFQERGWAVVDTEQLPMARQIQLFSNAEMICAPHGAGLTNLLWCRPGCKIIELCPSTYLNGLYEGLAECVHAQYRYLIMEADNAYRARVDLAALERAIEF